MNILVTGANGFIGKNLCFRLTELGYENIIKITRSSTIKDIEDVIDSIDFIYHLAGINRPKDKNEFHSGNVNFTEEILEILKTKNKRIPIAFSSSTQAVNDSLYGKTKLLAELAIESHCKSNNSQYFIFRLPNVFGKWSKPNYNSFVSTFCHNIANDIEIKVHDPKSQVELVYIDDVCDEFIALLIDKNSSGYMECSSTYHTTVGYVAEQLNLYKQSRETLMIENVGVGLNRALYSTYLSFYNKNQFTYKIKSNKDKRGSFSEFLKTKDSGQISFFTAHPGITRGGHYHHSKNEKFLIVKGEARFRFENIVTSEKYELYINADDLEVVETVPGWSHDITNMGNDEMIVMIWANEIFDKDSPDTIWKPLE